MLTLFATSVVGTTIQADGFRYTLIKEQSECNSNDLWLGKRSLKSCAEECARRRDCRFFIHGKEGTKLDDCYVEYTVGRKCPEGWEEDAFDFWEIGAPWIGCTEPRAGADDVVQHHADAGPGGGAGKRDLGARAGGAAALDGRAARRPAG